jgi:2-polyprenyl-3-methyl-5-hydroxy-6-metoxy-1,4-benzoquinol methylase
MAERSGVAWRAARRLRTSPALYGAARRAYTAAGRVLPPRRIAGIPGPVHRNDLMVDPASDHSRTTYVERGRQVVALLDDALAGTGRTLADAEVLDFGCGHGRIVRHLAAAARSVSACDLDHEGVRFCASAFGAVEVPGSTDLAEVPLGAYDAIWLGSVITHHPPPTCADLLAALAGHLRPGGVLVVSSADHVTLQVDLDAAGRGWMQEQAERLRRELLADGATYVAYPQVADGSYGLGYQTDAWLDAAVSGHGLTPLWHRSDDWGPQATHAWLRPT